MAGHASRERTAEQFAYHCEAEAFVFAERDDRARRINNCVLRVGRGLAVVVDQAPGRHLLALVVGHARLALRHHAGGEIEQDRLAARHRDADRERVGAEARIAAAEGRDDRARDDVGEMHRDEVGLDGHLRPCADTAQVVRIAERDDAAAELLGARNAHLHGLMADDLAEPGLPVEAQHRATVERSLHVGVRRQAALDERLGILRQHADAVRVMAGQVGLDEVLGDEVDLARLAAEPAHQRLDRRGQRLFANRVNLGHALLTPVMVRSGRS